MTRFRNSSYACFSSAPFNVSQIHGSSFFRKWLIHLMLYQPNAKSNKRLAGKKGKTEARRRGLCTVLIQVLSPSLFQWTDSGPLLGPWVITFHRLEEFSIRSSTHGIDFLFHGCIAANLKGESNSG